MTCGVCGRRNAEVPAGRTWAPCPSCGAMVFRGAQGPLVLIAHGSTEMSEEIGSVLLREGFSAVRAADGKQAVGVLGRLKPRAAVIDVGLDVVPAFQLIERLRAEPELGAVKVVLVASVYDRTAYKRRPRSLYGADDYVEQHHIPDMLPKKLGALLAVRTSGEAAAETVTLRQRIHHAEQQLPAGDLATRAWALARRIVADVALYHQPEVVAALNGEVGPGLAAALAEGRRILPEMLGAPAPQGPQIIDQAWRELLDAMEGVRR